MKYDKIDTLQLVFQSYILDILKQLEKEPKRFTELRVYVKTKRTLSIKISKLLEYGLIEVFPQLVTGKLRYANYYKLTKKGKQILERIAKI